jgi:hypothetical protein
MLGTKSDILETSLNTQNFQCIACPQRYFRWTLSHMPIHMSFIIYSKYNFTYIFHRSEKERPQPIILLQDSKDCGILTCRPLFLQRFAGIKVLFYSLMQVGLNYIRNTGPIIWISSVVQWMFCSFIIKITVFWNVTPCSLVEFMFWRKQVP